METEEMEEIRKIAKGIAKEIANNEELQELMKPIFEYASSKDIDCKIMKLADNLADKMIDLIEIFNIKKENIDDEIKKELIINLEAFINSLDKIIAKIEQ